MLVWCTSCWCIVWFLYWSRSVERWAPVLTLRARSWSSISSWISSTKGRKLQPWIDATTAPVEFSWVLLLSHVMKIISFGDRSQEIAGVGHQPPPGPLGVDLSMLLCYDDHRHIFRNSLRSERRNCWLSPSSWHFDKRDASGRCKFPRDAARSCWSSKKRTTSNERRNKIGNECSMQFPSNERAVHNNKVQLVNIQSQRGR